MQSVTEAKRKALLDHKQNFCSNTDDALKAAISNAQQTARPCANEYWQTLCAQIQSAADCGYVRRMYERIKTGNGPTSIKTAPLKSKTGETITDQSKQLQQWVEHHLELYVTQNIITDAALDALPAVPVMEEIDICPHWRSSAKP